MMHTYMVTCDWYIGNSVYEGRASLKQPSDSSTRIYIYLYTYTNAKSIPSHRRTSWSLYMAKTTPSHKNYMFLDSTKYLFPGNDALSNRTCIY